jgi:Protein of unknown function (DUF3738)
MLAGRARQSFQKSAFARWIVTRTPLEGLCVSGFVVGQSAIHAVVNAPGSKIGTAGAVSALVNELPQMWHSPVADQAGLEDTFDFSLEPSAVDSQPGEREVIAG